MASPRGQLAAQDWKKIGTGFGIVMAGTALTFVAEQVVPLLESTGDTFKVMLAGMLMVAINAGRKLLSDTRPTQRQIRDLQLSSRR